MVNAAPYAPEHTMPFEPPFHTVFKPLRPVPAGDPRPDPMSPTVVRVAVEPIADALLAWCNGRVPVLDTEAVIFSVTVAVIHAGADSFRIGTTLREQFHFPVDRALITLLDEVVDRLPAALKIVVGKWSARNGMRFPAKDGDLIEFLDDTETPVAARVYAVDKLLCLALVIRQSDERTTRVCAEQVIANRTQSRYEPETPVLGARYENAPALMEAANAEDRARKRAGAATPVGPALTPPPRDPQPPRAA